MADVLLTKVSKVYPGGVKAVDAIDLAIADGSFVVLVGPSGCGKSTTLRMIAGLEEISSGTISIGGRVVNDIPARDRDIAMVFQSYALYPHLSVRQNLEFPLLRRRRHASLLRSLVSPSYAQARRAEIAAMADRVEKAAKTLEITALLARKPKELSGGQRQRVALGRALVRDPAVFLLDEPLSNLDARLRLEMRAELRMLHRRTGGTMVHVTHDQEEAMTLGDRLVVMKDGVIRQAGSPIEIYEEPADAFVAGFIGTPAMNLVEGEVTLGDGAARFHAGAASAPAFSIDLPPALAEVAAKHARGERSLRVTLGVRPDAVRATGQATGSGNASSHGSPIAASLEALERYGDRIDLVLDTGGVRLVSRGEGSGGASLREGAPIAISLDLAKAHLFARDDAAKRLR
ncbi:MAG: ABC transporter ATP-binding protein [Phycisphaerales bacterium]